MIGMDPMADTTNDWMTISTTMDSTEDVDACRLDAGDVGEQRQNQRNPCFGSGCSIVDLGGSR